MPRLRFRPVLAVLLALVAPPLALVAAVPPARAGDTVPVTGRAVDPDGRPVPGARVVALPARKTDLLAAPADWRRANGSGGEDGRFTVPVPAGCPAWLEVRAPGFAPARVEVPAPGPRGTDLGDIPLPRGARLVAVLTDEADRPVSSRPFTLRVRPAGGLLGAGQTIRDGDDRVTWSGDGKLAVDRLAPGTAELELDVSGFATADLGRVELRDGRTLDLGAVPLRRGGVIEGIVRAPGGEPLADADVTVKVPGVLWKEARTDRAGRFAVGGLPAGAECEVAVDAREGAPWQGTARPGDRLEVRLAPPGKVTGTVVLGPERTPVHPFTVRFDRVDEKAPAFPGVPAAGAAAAFRGRDRSFDAADGSFELTGLAAGTWRITVEYAGALPRTLGGVEVRAGETTALGTIVLDPGREVSGTVVDAETGEPVRGATVEPAVDDPFLRTRRRMDAYGKGAAPGARSDARGRFRLAGLRPGSVDLEVSAEGYAPARVEAEIPREGEPADLEVKLSRGGTIEGTVRSPAGTPIAGAMVMVMRGMMPDMDHAAQTDAAGRYRIEHLPPGPVTVTVMPPGKKGMPVDPAGLQLRVVTVPAGGTVRADFPEPAGGIELSGRVRGADGPAPGIRLAFTKRDGAAAGRMIPATADEAGNYRVSLPAPGRWEVTVMRIAPGESTGPRVTTAALRVEVPPGRPAVRRDLVLPAATVRVTVTDTAGRPLAGAVVLLVPGEGDEFSPAVAGNTGRRGEAVLRWVPAGSWRLLAAAPGRAIGTTDSLDVGDDGEVAAEIILAPADPVPARVLGPGGTPVAGARAILLDEPLADATTLPGAPSDEDGRLTLEGLPDGTWQVAAVAPRLGVAWTEVTVPPPDDTPAEIRFEETAPVTLVAKGEDGNPAPGARVVSLRPAGGPELGPVLALATLAGGDSRALLSGKDGRLRLPPLPAGRYEVTLAADGREGTRRFRVAGKPLSVEVELAAP